MLKKFKNIVLVGTSHISKESISLVETTIQTEKPNIIAIELDRSRFQSIISKKRQKISLVEVRKIGMKGFLFRVIGAWISQKLGKETGIVPGSEMKTAIKLAKELNISIALIDQDISITLRNISKRITWKERFMFIRDVLATVFTSKKQLKIDLNKVPSKEKISLLSKKLKKDYPTIYQALISDRDQHMSKALNKLSQENKDGKIVAVVGAGHIEGITRTLKKWSKKTVGRN
ncbi:MAG: TraB domain-containing protein [Nanoarchaeota archaeon]|nr:TraB domain-containing protein [Nanoarchaeota archaeon]